MPANRFPVSDMFEDLVRHGHIKPIIRMEEMELPGAYPQVPSVISYTTPDVPIRSGDIDAQLVRADGPVRPALRFEVVTRLLGIVENRIGEIDHGKPQWLVERSEDAFSRADTRSGRLFASGLETSGGRENET